MLLSSFPRREKILVCIVGPKEDQILIRLGEEISPLHRLATFPGKVLMMRSALFISTLTTLRAANPRINSLLSIPLLLVNHSRAMLFRISNGRN